MDNDECSPTQLWELPDSACQNFHWVGYLAMELAKGEIVFVFKIASFVLINPLFRVPGGAMSLYRFLQSYHCILSVRASEDSH